MECLHFENLSLEGTMKLCDFLQNQKCCLSLEHPQNWICFVSFGFLSSRLPCKHGYSNYFCSIKSLVQKKTHKFSTTWYENDSFLPQPYIVHIHKSMTKTQPRFSMKYEIFIQVQNQFKFYIAQFAII